LIKDWHAYLLFWGESYPGMVNLNGLDEAIQVCRAEAFDWAISQILA
jgi:hypothetical protein